MCISSIWETKIQKADIQVYIDLISVALLFGLFRGLPRGRSDAPTPSRAAIDRCQPSSPYGRLRSTHSRTAANSATVAGSFTHSNQPRGRGTGPSCQ